ncbi:hypothetical protein ACIBBB_03245 [Streptomyces sp. NPDC051217]|uniref:hypothetical protein n=1 Tax=Streptomyces sp. NPDC051217 TaxID=3365644 RepID=UPI0037897EA6
MNGATNSPSRSEGSAPNAVAWVRTWGASPQAPDNSGSFIEPFENSTLRQVVRVSGGGHRIRIRISNEYGTAPLTIGAARVAIADSESEIQAGSGHAVTFSGRPTATVPAGAPILSDPIDLRTAALSRLTISLYLPGPVDTATCHGTFHTLGWLIRDDATALTSLPTNAAPLPAQALITAVEVQPDTPTKASRDRGLPRRWHRLHARHGSALDRLARRSAWTPAADRRAA